jgi:predicted O-methyltransferase YrrM
MTPKDLTPEQRRQRAEQLLEKIRGVMVPHSEGSIMKGSAAAGLIQRLDGMYFERILEIGTCRGVGAAVLSCFADTVVTIDIVGRGEVPWIMALADAEHRIIPVVTTEAGKQRLVRALRFDMCFIDGNHKYDWVKADFELVRSLCKQILFHDYPDSGSGLRGVGQLLDDDKPDGVIKRCEPFAWWRPK